MWFWIFMMVMSLVLPVLLIGCGSWFWKRPPGKINSVYGYRTKMSMKNMETWRFAHQQCGKIWIRIGWILLFGSALVMPALICQNENVIGVAGSMLMTVQCIALILPVIWTEKGLRETFDADGNRIK